MNYPISACCNLLKTYFTFPISPAVTVSQHFLLYWLILSCHFFRYFFAILFQHYFLSDSFFTHFFNTCSTLSLHFFKTFSTLYQHSLNTFATISLKMHYEHQSISWTTSISCLAIFFCLSKPCNNILKMYY